MGSKQAYYNNKSEKSVEERDVNTWDDGGSSNGKIKHLSGS